MIIKFILAVALVAGFMFVNVQAQKEKMDLDRYIATGKTIVIAKVLSRTPVTRGGSYDATVQILHVVKGAEKPREISITLKFTPIEVGEIYLLRTEAEADVKDQPYFYVHGHASAVPIASSENIEELKTLPVRIIILRTMNLRKYHLDSEIQRRTYELNELQEITKGQ